MARMKDGQQSIFYIAADTVKSAKSAPFLEKLRQKGLEVGAGREAVKGESMEGGVERGGAVGGGGGGVGRGNQGGMSGHGVAGMTLLLHLCACLACTWPRRGGNRKEGGDGGDLFCYE